MVLNTAVTLNVTLFLHKMNTYLSCYCLEWGKKKHNVINFLLIDLLLIFNLRKGIFHFYRINFFNVRNRISSCTMLMYTIILPSLSLSLLVSLYIYIYISYHIYVLSKICLSRILYNLSIVTSDAQHFLISFSFLADFNNVTAFRGDFTYDTANASSKGRRTVKGIPGSSLPLETTLRVISELGPTLRMERGKVIRMYACPWCLRHFTRKENLKLHVRYIHGPLESLTCKLCGNKYKNSNSLRVHSYLYHNAKRDKQPSKSLTAGGDDGRDA